MHSLWERSALIRPDNEARFLPRESAQAINFRASWLWPGRSFTGKVSAIGVVDIGSERFPDELGRARIKQVSGRGFEY